MPCGRVAVDTDASLLDVDLVLDFLSGSYWAQGIPRSVVEQSIASSLCFGIYVDDKQTGFARVISDYATFAYLADVFILESYRGQGLADHLIREVLGHEKVQGLRRWLLVTRDAHGLYAKHGFKPLAAPDRFMELHRADVYRK